MKEIKKLDYLSFAIVEGLCSAVITFIVGVIITAAGMSIFLPFAVMGVIYLLIAPIFGFIGGFIGGLIVAILYNFIISRYIKIKAK